MTAPVPPDANGLRGVEAMARAMYETGLLNLPLSDSLDIDCHDAARAALAVLAASEAAAAAIPYDDRLVTCPECRSTFEVEDGSVILAASEAAPTESGGES